MIYPTVRITLAMASASLLLAACGTRSAPIWPAFGGDPARGAVIIGRAQCGACHEIPGIADAHGLVGPPLAKFGRRTMIAGMLPNTPDALVHWLRDPQSVTPGNAMPSTGLTEPQARDVAAYLYTQR
jgi:cytochrome c1